MERRGRRHEGEIAYMEFDSVDEDGMAHAMVPLLGRYLHKDGLLAQFEREAALWDAGAAAEPETNAESPAECAQVAAALRRIMEEVRTW